MEFKMSELPNTVEQIAAFIVGLLNADTNEKWEATVEVEGWDAKVILRQGEFGWQLHYSAGDKLFFVLAQAVSAYYHWEKLHEHSTNPPN